MCERCLAVVQKYFPEIADDDVGDFLMSHTAFPAGSADLIERQVMELASRQDVPMEVQGMSNDDDLQKVVNKVKRILRDADKNEDVEMAHIEADDSLCALLLALGYEDVVSLYRKLHKWYG